LTRFIETRVQTVPMGASSEPAIRALCQLTQLLCNSRRVEKRLAALYIGSLQEDFDWTWDCRTLLGR
jgi:hypothetical protein